VHGSVEIGVTPWLDDADGGAEALARQAELAESLGFHSFWLPESHFTGHGAIPSPLMRLAVVAARTQRLLLGTTSYLLPVRHPIHAAEEVAVLDRLSGGRVILGVGRGFRRALFRAFDVPVKEKRDRFEANLDLMVKAWRGEAGAWDDGGDGEPSPIHLSPRPVQEPHPPIWVAGFGPKAVAQAGRLGLPYLASPIEPLARLEENYARQREALPDAVDADELPVPVMRTLFVSRDPASLAAVREGLTAQAKAMAMSPLASMRGLAGAELEDWAIVGEPEQVIERVALYRERLGMTHLIARGLVPGVKLEQVEESLREIAELPF
jgi:alkanesulfonate monooxygenase SsuD/methylene tetrahydromethanopterin reductase-like flavin-dependent oxidoreductase (luciferase family)